MDVVAGLLVDFGSVTMVKKEDVYLAIKVIDDVA